MSVAPRSSVLSGPEHTVPGAVAVAELAPALALGLCRGWAPKPYAYLDPNEDVVAAVDGVRGRLLVVADGHSGQESSVTAVEAVLDQLGADPPPADLSDRELLGVVEEANRAVYRAVVGLPTPRRHSRTTLVVVLQSGRRIQWATLGDSVAILAAPGSSRLLAEPTHRFVGGPAPGGLGDLCATGSSEVPGGAWVIVATDGYSDWAPAGGDLARATALWTAGAPDAPTVVRRLLDKARTGGAGDNVAVAAARVPG